MTWLALNLIIREAFYSEDTVVVSVDFSSLRTYLVFYKMLLSMLVSMLFCVAELPRLITYYAKSNSL